MLTSLSSSGWRPIIHEFDSWMSPNLVRADELDLSWLDSVGQPKALEIQSTSDTKLVSSGTISLHFQIDEPRVQVTVSVVKGPAILVVIEKTFIDRAVKSVYPAKCKIIPYL